MAIFEVPVTVQIKAKSKSDAVAKVLAFVEYAQDVGNDDGDVQGALVGTAEETKRLGN